MLQSAYGITCTVGPNLLTCYNVHFNKVKLYSVFFFFLVQVMRSYFRRADPFFDEQENHSLIGVANVFLSCLFYDVKLQYAVPIINQKGEVGTNVFCYICFVELSLEYVDLVFCEFLQRILRVFRIIGDIRV